MSLESMVDPNIVGNAFVQRYYNHLYESPSEVHQFYLEDSVLGRPGPDGEIVSVKSLKAINEQIMSFDYVNSKIQILTADSQSSHENGIVTLVTGLLTVKSGERMSFSQSFFLVPKKGSYFVLNDLFRYVSDEVVEPEATEKVAVETSPQVVQTNEVAETVTVTTQQPVEKQQERANGHSKTLEEKVVNDVSNGVDAPKKSFAVIVQSLAQDGATFKSKASPLKPKPIKKPSSDPEHKAHAPVSAEKVDKEGGDGTIFVANLPMDATPEQLNEAFKGFGAIKKDCIQIRSYRLKGNCFGFVTYESPEAVKLVLQAHRELAIRIGNRRVSIEVKKGNVENGRASMRNRGYRGENGFRNDRPRPRGNSSSGGYDRRQGEVKNGEVYQNGSVKASREVAQSRS